MSPPRNLAASIHRRLLNGARERGEDPQFILQRYAAERFLYRHEAVVAEKLHAMVVLGERNSRYKDFYDLHVLARQFLFHGATLAGSIAATFERRRTTLDTALPVALAPRFFADSARAEQWRAYLTRNALPGAPADFGAVGEQILAFLGPPWTALAARTLFSGVWRPAGPWLQQATTEEPAR